MRLLDLFLNRLDREHAPSADVTLLEPELLDRELREIRLTQEGATNLDLVFRHLGLALRQPGSPDTFHLSGGRGCGRSTWLKLLAALLAPSRAGGEGWRTLLAPLLQEKGLQADLEALLAEGGVDAVPLLWDEEALEGESCGGVAGILRRAFHIHLECEGDVPWLAEMERHLQERNQYQVFQSEYTSLTGEPWKQARRLFCFDMDTIIRTLVLVTGRSWEDVSTWLDELERESRSEEDHFLRVLVAHLQARGRGHRVLFLVDNQGAKPFSTSCLDRLNRFWLKVQQHLAGQVFLLLTSCESEHDFAERISLLPGAGFQFRSLVPFNWSHQKDLIRQVVLAKHPSMVSAIQSAFESAASKRLYLAERFRTTLGEEPYGDLQAWMDWYPFLPYQMDLLGALRNQNPALAEEGCTLLNWIRQLLRQDGQASLGLLKPLGDFWPPCGIRTVNEEPEERHRQRVLGCLAFLHAMDGRAASLDELVLFNLTSLGASLEEERQKTAEDLLFWAAQGRIASCGQGRWQWVAPLDEAEAEKTEPGKDMGAPLTGDTTQPEETRHDPVAEHQEVVRRFGVDHLPEREQLRAIRGLLFTGADELRRFSALYGLNPYPGQELVAEGRLLLKPLVDMESTSVLGETLGVYGLAVADFWERFQPLRTFFEHHRLLFDMALELHQGLDGHEEVVHGALQNPWRQLRAFLEQPLNQPVPMDPSEWMDPLEGCLRRNLRDGKIHFLMRIEELAQRLAAPWEDSWQRPDPEAVAEACRHLDVWAREIEAVERLPQLRALQERLEEAENAFQAMGALPRERREFLVDELAARFPLISDPEDLRQVLDYLFREMGPWVERGMPVHLVGSSGVSADSRPGREEEEGGHAGI